MKSYRIYLLGHDGRVSLGEAIEGPSDRDAARLAASLAPKGQDCELWDGGRLVGRFSKAGVFIAT